MSLDSQMRMKQEDVRLLLRLPPKRVSLVQTDKVIPLLKWLAFSATDEEQVSFLTSNVPCFCLKVPCFCPSVPCLCLNVLCFCPSVPCLCLNVLCFCQHLLWEWANQTHWQLAGDDELSNEARQPKAVRRALSRNRTSAAQREVLNARRVTVGAAPLKVRAQYGL
jgi:hypothetical protein